MFTGIIERTAKIKSVSKAFLSVENVFNKKELETGESIAVNGVCLTLSSFDDKIISFDTSPETVKKTAFKFYPPGCIVNLERALRPSDRLGGHFVTGHIDGTGKVLKIEKKGYSHILRLKTFPNEFIAEKGSVAVNGISLTCYDIKDSSFEVSIIPHTWESTNLKFLKEGDTVNIELDILAKYARNKISKESPITLKFLKENGYI